MLDTKRKALWKEIRDEVIGQAYAMSRDDKYEDAGRAVKIYVNLPEKLSDKTSLCDQLSCIEGLHVGWGRFALKEQIFERIKDMKL
jgi:hypothetical protein